MELLLSVVVGGLFAAGLYMMLRRSLVKLVLGLALIGQAINLLIFVMGRLTRGAPPLVQQDNVLPVEPFADPLPQALILTAIVISFGVQAFALILIKRVYRVVGTDDLDEMRETESLD